MKVHVQFFSHLKDVMRTSELDIDAAEGMQVGDLLELLYAREPALRAWDGTILVGAGVEFVERNHLLQAGEEIAIMPPVQGG